MISIFILLAISAVSGFALGRGRLSWHAILVAGAVLAPLSAVILRIQGFGALSGISTIVACLIVNQIAYWIGAAGANGDPRNPEGPPHEQADVVLRERRDNDIPREHKRQHNLRSHFIGHGKQPW
jgi:hypothetical protein